MHANEKLIREADEAMLRGDNEAFIAYHADDVIVHVPGNSKIAGTYKGKDEFAELFGRFMELTPGYTFEPHSYMADDDHVVALQRSHYERDGKSLDANDVFVAHVRDGKFTELWFMTEDQAALDAFLG